MSYHTGMEWACPLCPILCCLRTYNSYESAGPLVIPMKDFYTSLLLSCWWLFVFRWRYWSLEPNIASNETENAETRSQRFPDFDQLKYSLRGVTENAPWFRKIYIVTNGQVPVWFNNSNPRVRISLIIKYSNTKSICPHFHQGTGFYLLSKLARTRISWQTDDLNH